MKVKITKLEENLEEKNNECTSLSKKNEELKKKCSDFKQRIYLSKIRKFISCDMCAEEFTNERLLKDHIKAIHMAEERENEHLKVRELNLNLEKKVQELEETIMRRKNRQHANMRNMRAYQREINERLAKAGFTYDVRFSSRYLGK